MCGHTRTLLLNKPTILSVCIMYSCELHDPFLCIVITCNIFKSYKEYCVIRNNCHSYINNNVKIELERIQESNCIHIVSNRFLFMLNWNKGELWFMWKDF